MAATLAIMKTVIALLQIIRTWPGLVWQRISGSPTDRLSLRWIVIVLVFDVVLGLMGSIGVRYSITPKIGWSAIIGLQATFSGIVSALLWVASATGPADPTVVNVRNAAAGTLSGVAVVFAFGTVTFRPENSVVIVVARNALAFSEITALLLVGLALWTVLRWQPQGNQARSRWWPLGE